MISRTLPTPPRFGVAADAAEIIVVLDRRSAEAAGFKGQSHPRLPGVTIWWPGCEPSGLMQRRWRRVTIDSSCRRASGAQRRDLEEALFEIRKGGHLHGDNFVWLEF